MSSKRFPIALVLLFFSVALVEARIFTDDKGREIEAELLVVGGNKVTFKKGDRKFTLPITRFSKEDQAYIRSWAVRETEAKNKNSPSVVVQPGGTLSFSFPELEKDFNGKPYRAAKGKHFYYAWGGSRPSPVEPEWLWRVRRKLR